MIERATRIAVKLLPRAAATGLTRVVASLTARSGVSPEEREILGGASSYRFGPQGLAAWELGKGPLVVCVHGWAGRAGQFAPLARRLAGLGYRVAALDVTGHGRSPGRRTSWRHFLDDIAAFAANLGEPAHAWIGHSAGALCLLALRRGGLLSAPRWVGVCPPSHPYPPIDQIRLRLAPGDAVLAACQDAIADEFGAHWRALEQGQIYRELGSETLLIHDTADRYLRAENETCLRGACPGARYVTTQGLGHSRILTSPILHNLVAEFVGGP